MNLNGEYYVLFGHSGSTSMGDGFLVTHRPTSNPAVTDEQVNVVRDTGVQGRGSFEGIKRALIQTHGIFMMIAWPILASTGIFFASFMRQALPNGEWFQVHRGLMIASLFVGAAGFVLVFFSQLRSNIPGLIDLGTGSASQVNSAYTGTCVYK